MITFDRHTLRLALSYLALIMVMSIGFSVVFYNTSWHELGRQLPPPSYVDFRADQGGGRSHFFEQRISEGRDRLLNELILLNIFALVGGALLSYYLARRSLEPIEEAVEAQSQFTSDASHELRTPLTAIQTRNEVALRKPKLDAKEARGVIESNLEEAKKLSRLAEGLLQLSYSNPGTLTLQPVPLNKITSEAQKNVLAAAQSKNIAIDDKTPKLIVSGDAHSLTEAVTILLDNAIKYSPEGSTVNLTGEAKGKNAFLHITDQGEGIKASDIPHIFRRFYRAEASRTKKGTDGYGLGLSIAEKIVHQLNGDISVRSIPGKGSTFTIKLPSA
jgi:signal transduction histidine kinase